MRRLPDLLERVIEPESGGLSPDHARYILSLGFTSAERQRYLELSERAQDGQLSPEDQAELEEFLTVNGLLMLLQSKARRSLNKPGTIG
jgi:hypothetical protein